LYLHIYMNYNDIDYIDIDYNDIDYSDIDCSDILFVSISIGIID